MISPTVVDYKKSCGELVREAIRLPAMYYRTLSEFEATLFGHRFAFQDLGVIERDDAFNLRFAHWIYEEHGEPAAKGCAFAISRLAESRGCEPGELFAELAEEFLERW
ncbi:hypothetical protein [Blastopirellula retiformator]|uniref:Uncharacterized protein n=1 Tax=Blastopirellula retiformator TaxID=2527970 RepID=A0A5C5V9G7_9BACT|nr:hypothetical protein [Blastopirellula retiformator]TWT34931.1 hypothetical protein Enr8_23470 [Blastopirellula retiformator]